VASLATRRGWWKQSTDSMSHGSAQGRQAGSSMAGGTRKRA
jgi:hypothetical protein